MDEALKTIESLLQTEHDSAKLQQLSLLQAQCFVGLKQSEKALPIYEALANDAPDPLKLAALQAIGSLHLAAGDLAKAEESFRAASGLYAQAEDARLKALGSAQYFRTRVDYDGAVKYAWARLRQLAAAYEKQGKLSEAAGLYRQVCDTYPEYPGARATAQRVGDLLARLGQRREAFGYYLRALDTGEDRVFRPVALLADNQWYLDEAAKPPARSLIHAALVGVNECLPSLGSSATLDAEALSKFEEQWYQGLQETFKSYGCQWRWTWRALAKDYPQHPWQALCMLASAQGLLRVGDYENAREDLGRIGPLPPNMKLLMGEAQYLRGLAYLGQVQHSEAEATFKALLGTGGDGQTEAKALYRLAELSEARLQWPQSKQYYRLAALKTTSQWQRRRAEYALTRIDDLAKLKCTTRPSVTLMPDDRNTRGDWTKAYGKERHILCAQNFIVDRTGGALPKIAYDFSTTSASEPSRLWVSQKRDDDPAALWDPGNQCRKSANRDDCGEQSPLGQGPDLLLKIEIPKASHVLSLYFVNDHNYYEPGRAFSLSFTDGAGVLQAMTTVENFGGGVYKRFLVSGPTELNIRIWRNLSLNTLLSGVFLDAPLDDQ
ncbi:MAG: tetratricopeptide repeat protein [Armatimonadota bacterium]